MKKMIGKHVIVTGATSGIGLETAREIAKQGAAVTLISRNEQKLRDTAARFQQESGNDKIDWIQADLSNIQSTKQGAETFLARHNRLDVLINNAGTFFSERKESVDGIEMTIALNHIGVFVLTNELLPLIKATAAGTGDGRIINVSSEAHRMAKFKWDDLESKKKYGGFPAYGLSKAMNVLHANRLARQLAGTGITANSLHPGGVNTNIWEGMDGMLSFLSNIAKRFMDTPEQGAQTSIHLATSPDVKGITGKYWAKSREKKPTPLMQKIEVQERLWEMSEAWVRQTKEW